MNRTVRTFVLAAGAAATCAAAWAQNYPAMPVRLIVAYSAGGGVDFVGRILAQRLSEVWGQTVTVENKSGASGAIGADFVAKAKPDGLTLLLASPAEVLVGPIAGQKTTYDPGKAFEPVVLAGETPLAIVAHPSVAATDLSGLLAGAKAGAPQVNSYGTPGAGSSMHFAGEALKQWSGLGMTHIPYRGAAPAVNDVLGNQIPLAIVGMPPVVAHVRSGKLKMLAVTTAMRSPAMPDVPTVSEIPGLKDYRFSNWMMVLTPTGTPAHVVAKVARDVAQVVQEPAVRRSLQEAGVEASGLQGAELRTFLNQERTRYSSVAKAGNIRYAE